jgi:hypothetical protein
MGMWWLYFKLMKVGKWVEMNVRVDLLNISAKLVAFILEMEKVGYMSL